jgi:hypothetical protein
VFSDKPLQVHAGLHGRAAWRAWFYSVRMTGMPDTKESSSNPGTWSHAVDLDEGGGDVRLFPQTARVSRFYGDIK